MESGAPGDDSLALARALRSLVNSSVTVGARRIGADHITDLHPLEAQAVANAVPKRVREFATGRALLRELIGEPCVIPMAADRRPVLPPGVRASLAHDAGYAVAIVTRDHHIRALGVDIEPTASLATSLATVILRDDEATLDAHLAFTLKEATYKAWSALGGRMLEHHDVRLRLSGSRFVAEVVGGGEAFGGSFAAVGHRWLAAVVA